MANNMIARTSPKNGLDLFKTPIKVIEELYLRVMQDIPTDSLICDFSCGTGNILNYFNIKGYKTFGADIEYYEEVPKFTDFQKVDFLSAAGGLVPNVSKSTRGIIVMNPPYNQITEFLKKTVELLNEDNFLDEAYILANLNVLASQSRKDFFRNSPLEAIYPHSKRIQFIDGKSSNINTCWLHFEKNFKGDARTKWLLD